MCIYLQSLDKSVGWSQAAAWDNSWSFYPRNGNHKRLGCTKTVALCASTTSSGPGCGGNVVKRVIGLEIFYCQVIEPELWAAGHVSNLGQPQRHRCTPLCSTGNTSSGSQPKYLPMMPHGCPVRAMQGCGWGKSGCCVSKILMWVQNHCHYCYHHESITCTVDQDCFLKVLWSYTDFNLPPTQVGTTTVIPRSLHCRIFFSHFLVTMYISFQLAVSNTKIIARRLIMRSFRACMYACG